jgi:hypothetical protein
MSSDARIIGYCRMCGKALDAVTSIRDDGRRAAALASLSETFERTGMQFGEQERAE